MADQTEPPGPRSPGITYQQLLDTDKFPVPEVLRLQSPKYLGSDDIPKERYTSRQWHEREVERLWRRVWQFACREEQLADVGSHVVYDIADLSFIVVRSAPERDQGVLQRLPAPWPRSSRITAGGVRRFRCPFHGCTWALDGSLRAIPARLGLRARRARRVRPARGEGRHVGRVRVHQPRPGGGVARGLPRRPDEALRALGAREPLHPGARPEGICGATGRSSRRRSASRTTRPTTHPADRRSTSATSTARSTSGRTTPG